MAGRCGVDGDLVLDPLSAPGAGIPGGQVVDEQDTHDGSVPVAVRLGGRRNGARGVERGQGYLVPSRRGPAGIVRLLWPIDSCPSPPAPCVARLASSPIPPPLRTRSSRCRGCGTRFVHPVPSAVALRARYEAEHQAGKWGALFGASDPIDPPRRARLLAGLDSGRGSGRLLDVGCGGRAFPRRGGGRVAPGGARALARRGLCPGESPSGAGRFAGGVARRAPVRGDHLLGRARAPV